MTGIPSSKNYDVTLMIYLLRNLTTVQPPSNGFDVLPPASEIHDGADLARIKYYRNRYAHFETDKLTSTDFLLIWEDITEVDNKCLNNNVMLIIFILMSIVVVVDCFSKTIPVVHRSIYALFQ